MVLAFSLETDVGMCLVEGELRVEGRVPFPRAAIRAGA